MSNDSKFSLIMNADNAGLMSAYHYDSLAYAPTAHSTVRSITFALNVGPHYTLPVTRATQTEFYLQYGTTVPTKLNAAEMEIRDGSVIHPHNHTDTHIYTRVLTQTHTHNLSGCFRRAEHKA